MTNFVSTIENLGAIERKMTFAVDLAAVQAATDKRLAKIAKTAKLQGFRPGKAPAKIIQQNYGYSAYSEAMNEQIGTAFTAAATSHSLRVAGMPSIEAVEDKASENNETVATEAVFAATFEVYPEVKLASFSDIEIEEFAADVTDADVDNTLSMLRKQRAVFKASSATAATGDKMTCNFEGKLDGVAFEGGTAKAFEFELGAKRMLPEFEVAALGMKAGDTKAFDIAFPEDYQAENLKGKTAQFTIEALGIQTPELPALDDAFAKTMAIPDGTLASLRADVRNNLQREVASRLLSKTKESALNGLDKAATLTVPKVLIEAENKEAAARMTEQMKQRGMDVGKMPMPLEMFSEESTRRVRLGLALGELVKAHNLKATPEQLRAKVDSMAASYQKPEEVAAWYFGNRDRLAELEAVVLEDNAVQWIIANAKTTKKMLPFQEVMGIQG